MDEFIRLLITLITLALTLPTLFTVLFYLIPYRVQVTQAAIEQRPRRVFIVGVINALFFGLVMAIFANEGEGGGLIAAIVLLGLLTLALIGLTAIVKLLQERIYGNGEVGSVLKTAVLFTGALLTPFIGWFVILPILAVIGLGAAISTLVRRRQNKAA